MSDTIHEFPHRCVKLTANGKSHSSEIEKLVCDTTGSSARVNLTQVKGGITNQLLLAEQNGRRILVRAFGHKTDTLIDRAREYAVHRQLMNLGLAPRLLCRFGNGLVYEYIPGKSALAEELSQPIVMKSVAHRLAQWHALLKREDVARLLPSARVEDIFYQLANWAKICPSGILPMSGKALEEEVEWIKHKLGARGGPIVMGHCDLQSGNILLSFDLAAASILSHTSKDVVLEADDIESSKAPVTYATFIDYEYAAPCPRAFDIANHLQEWQGYECAKERVLEPSRCDSQLQFWVKHYLHAYEFYKQEHVETSVMDIIDELTVWWGVPGFYWGIWSAIQSTISDIDFGYDTYAKKRFSEYTDWKTRIWPAI